MYKYTVVFILFNIAVFVFVGFVFVAPIAASVKSGRANVRLQERRITAENRLLEAYADNLLALEENNAASRVLPRGDMLNALSEIDALGVSFGVESVEFFASEIAESVIDEERNFYEMRVRAEYQGAFDDLTLFMYEFLSGYGHIRSFYFSQSEGISRLRIEFSLFGVD